MGLGTLRVVSAISCFVLGILVAGGMIFAFYFIDEVLQKEIRIVTAYPGSKDEKKYKDWHDNRKSSVKEYQVYNVFSYPNVSQILDGNGLVAPVHMEQYGPYVYRRFEIYLNVSFHDDGAKITYTDQSYYVFDEEKSDMQGCKGPGGGKCDPTKDIITQVNVGYIALINTAGGEKNVLTLMSSGVMPKLIEPLQIALVELATPAASSTVYKDLIVSISEQMNYTATQATQLFLQSWGNATELPFPSYPPAMLLSNKVHANVSVQTAAWLWSDLPYGLFNESTVPLWMGADANADCPTQQGPVPCRSLLGQIFSLSPMQVGLILQWRQTLVFNYNTVYEKIYDNTPLSLLGYRQWGLGDLYPDGLQEVLGLSIVPELAVFVKSLGQVSTINATHAQSLLQTGGYGLGSPEILGMFLQFVQLGTPDAAKELQELWGLDPTQAGLLAYYITMDIATSDLVMQAMKTFQVQGSTYFNQYTVNDFLWNATDPLVNLVNGAVTPVNLQTNQTTPEQALNSPDASFYAQYTGRGELSQSSEYYGWRKWYGAIPSRVDDPVNGKYPKPIPIMGRDGVYAGASVRAGGVRHADGKDQVDVFVDETWRPLRLQYGYKVKVRDIKVNRFIPDKSMLQYDPGLDQNFPEGGFFNMTVTSNGLPLFISRSRMLYAPERWTTQLLVVPNNATLDKVATVEADELYLDIEPLTGLTLYGHKRMMANLYTGDTNLFDVFSPNLRTVLMLPLFTADLTSKVPSKDGKDLKAFIDFFDFYHKQGVMLLWLGVALGEVCLAVGALVTARHFVSRGKSRQYELVNTSYIQ